MSIKRKHDYGEEKFTSVKRMERSEKYPGEGERGRAYGAWRIIKNDTTPS